MLSFHRMSTSWESSPQSTNASEVWAVVKHAELRGLCAASKPERRLSPGHVTVGLGYIEEAGWLSTSSGTVD